MTHYRICTDESPEADECAVCRAPLRGRGPVCSVACEALADAATTLPLDPLEALVPRGRSDRDLLPPPFVGLTVEDALPEWL